MLEKSICVFCSSSEVIDSTYFSIARELGLEMVRQGFGLVHGGASVGLMSVLTKSVQTAGGKVVGIIPQRIYDFGLGDERLDELIITKTMHERKAEMEKRSEAFIALPGGFGTLEEIMEIFTLRHLKYHHKPIVLLNANGFYNHLLAHFEKIYKQRFAKEEYRRLYYTTEQPVKALTFIKNYRAPKPDKPQPKS